MIRHASALVSGVIGQTLHLAILLRVTLIKSQITLLGEVALTSVGIVSLQPVRRGHHVRFNSHHHFLI